MDYGPPVNPPTHPKYQNNEESSTTEVVHFSQMKILGYHYLLVNAKLNSFYGQSKIFRSSTSLTGNDFVHIGLNPIWIFSSQQIEIYRLKLVKHWRDPSFESNLLLKVVLLYPLQLYQEGFYQIDLSPHVGLKSNMDMSRTIYQKFLMPPYK